LEITTTVTFFDGRDFMALIKCPECGAEVSDRANECIKCGFPLNRPAGGVASVAKNKPVGVTASMAKNEPLGLTVSEKEEMFGKLSDRWAWALDGVLASCLVALIIVGEEKSAIIGVAAFVLNTVFWLLDKRELEAKEYASGWLWLGILVPIYLFIRAAVTKKYACAVVYVVLFVVGCIFLGFMETLEEEYASVGAEASSIPVVEVDGGLNKGQVSNNDFEVLAGEIKSIDGACTTASFRLLRLKTADTPQKQRLKIFIDSLLYNGMPAEKYLKELKQEYSGMENCGEGSVEMGIPEWDVTGKYLRFAWYIEECNVGCYGGKRSYVIDTRALKHFSQHELLVNTGSAEFKKLIIKHLRGSHYYEYVDKDALYESLRDEAYEVSFEKEGVRFQWDKTQIAAYAFGYPETTIPRSEMENHLSSVGNDLLMTLENVNNIP
jgi:ribosomal protein S27E